MNFTVKELLKSINLVEDVKDVGDASKLWKKVWRDNEYTGASPHVLDAKKTNQGYKTITKDDENNEYMVHHVHHDGTFHHMPQSTHSSLKAAKKSLNEE